MATLTAEEALENISQKILAYQEEQERLAKGLARVELSAPSSYQRRLAARSLRRARRWLKQFEVARS